MVYTRRATDRCLAKKIWDFLEPYLKTGGWTAIIGSMGTMAYALISFIIQGNASAAALIDYQIFKSTTQITLAQMQQEVHDMHEWMKADNR